MTASEMRRRVEIDCDRHGSTRCDPYTGECLECLAATPRCAGSSCGCPGLGDPDPGAHDPNECLMGEFR